MCANACGCANYRPAPTPAPIQPRQAPTGPVGGPTALAMGQRRPNWLPWLLVALVVILGRSR